MAKKRRKSPSASATTAKTRSRRPPRQPANDLPITPQPFLAAQLDGPPPGRPVATKGGAVRALLQRTRDLDVVPTVGNEELQRALDRLPKAGVSIAQLPEDIQETLAAFPGLAAMSVGRDINSARPPNLLS